MPLRDHFHGPLEEDMPWSSFQSAWVNTLVRQLNERSLPERYRALPQAHLGAPAKLARAWPGELPDQDVFEVRVHDRRSSRLVAAIELVSPANKDRPAHRDAFTAKCASLLQQGVGLLIVDIVTDRLNGSQGEVPSLLHRPSGCEFQLTAMVSMFTPALP